jgi:hypothetical protein
MPRPVPKTELTAEEQALAGPRATKHPESWEYAYQLDYAIGTVWDGLNAKEERFNELLEDAKKHRIYERLEPPFASYEEYLQARTGRGIPELARLLNSRFSPSQIAELISHLEGA